MTLLGTSDGLVSEGEFKQKNRNRSELTVPHKV